MATKKSNTPTTAKTYTCYICGEVIYGEHVFIQTKRRSKLHIHFECVPGRSEAK